MKKKFTPALTMVDGIPVSTVSYNGGMDILIVTGMKQYVDMISVLFMRGYSYVGICEIGIRRWRREW